MLLFYTYVPKSHIEKVKSALFSAGAGRVGDYQHCCWESVGRGQFMPMPGSSPHLGEQDKLSAVDEVKLEMVCLAKDKAVIKTALFEAHPYEEVAYGFIVVET